jgi:hypothetical protein
MIEIKDMNKPIANITVLAYWDFYDYATGGVVEKGRAVKIRATPQYGEMIIGVPGKPNAIVRDFKFSGIKEKLPCYEVFL